MNCPHCELFFRVDPIRCVCGAVFSEPAPIQVVFSRRLSEIRTYIRQHSGSLRDACFGYMREHNLLESLPKHLLTDDEREAMAEREAIREEATT